LLRKEENNVQGPQRAGVGFFGAWFPPGCEQPGSLTGPGLTNDQDPIIDETCFMGFDHIIFYTFDEEIEAKATLLRSSGRPMAWATGERL